MCIKFAERFLHFLLIIFLKIYEMCIIHGMEHFASQILMQNVLCENEKKM